MKIAQVGIVAALGLMLAACATVSRKKQQRVEQINQVGIYSYQRAIGGPPR